MRLTALGLGGACVLVMACSSSTPSSFAGTYNATIVEGANNCNLTNWMQGNSAGDITLQITQDGSMAQANIGGVAGTLLNLTLGASSFSGTVSGDMFTSTFFGTVMGTQGACKFTVNMTINATIDTNNNLSGTIALTPQTNNDPSCGVLDMCTNDETMTAARTGP